MPTIIPTPWTAIELQKYRTKLLRRTKRTMMEYHEVLTFLLEDVLQITDLEGRVHELETEVDNLKLDMNKLKDDEIMHLREINRLQAQRPSSPVMVQANPNMQQATQTNNPPLSPPPTVSPKAFIPPKAIKHLSGNLKKDYQREIKQIFTGEVLLPSQIQALNGFEDRKEITIEEDDVPFLEEQAKIFYNVEKEESEKENDTTQTT